MPRLIQPSFARGEIGPDLYGRVDVAAYAVALRTCINCVVHSYGGASNRAGLMFSTPCKVHTGTPPRLIRFKFNTEDTYILEFGNQYMRVIRNDAQILEDPKTIINVTQTNPATVSIDVPHGFSNGQDIYIDGVEGMTELNGRWFTIQNITANTFDLLDQVTKNLIDSTSYKAYTSGGTASRVYELATPYDIEDVLRLNFVQSANVMTLVHPKYDPRELSRLDHNDWRLRIIAFEPEQAYPTDFKGVASGGSGTKYRYRVTAINDESQEESLPGLDDQPKTITNATQTDPVVISATNDYVNGDEVEINDIVGMVELNNRRFTVANRTAGSFELEGVDGTGFTAYVSGGRSNRTFIEIDSGATPGADVEWVAAVDAGQYSVYRENNGLFGWIGNTEQLKFSDANIEADLNLTPPKGRNPFVGEGNYPRAVSYYKQRRTFGGTANKPDTVEYSVTGSQSNMSKSSPRQADDAITATLNALEVNEIRAFVPLRDLVIMTSGAEWQINAGAESVFSAENLNQNPQTNWGISELRPLVVGKDILFVTDNCACVRTLNYQIQIDGYEGNDMTVFSPHIFEFNEITDWALARSRESHILAIRDDGWLGSFTFNPEQEVIAWARWNTNGNFLRVAATRPNAQEQYEFPYFVVQRFLNGNSAYYIERLKDRRFENVKDCFFVDSGLTYDIPISITDVAVGNPIVVKAPGHGFVANDEIDLSDIVWEPDVDKFYNLVQPDQLNEKRFLIVDITNDEFSLCDPDIGNRMDITNIEKNTDPWVNVSELNTEANLVEGKVIGIFNVSGMTEVNDRMFKIGTVDNLRFKLRDLNNNPVDTSGFTDYQFGGSIYPSIDGTDYNIYRTGGNARKAIIQVGGLWHLEGLEVIALADGNVIDELIVKNGVAIPKDEEAQQQQQTTSGEIDTFDTRYSRVHIGLRYVSDIGTLDPENNAGETIQGKSMRTPEIIARLKDTRGLLYGPDENRLEEMLQREDEPFDQPTALFSGDRPLGVIADWANGGRVYMRQIYPLPLTLLALISKLDIGDEDDI